MTTKNPAHKGFYTSRNLVHGYLRNLRFKLRIPTQIFHIIHYFYHFAPLSFNKKDHGSVSFTGDTKVELHETSIAVADYIISSAIYDYFSWEIEINKVGYYSYVGFVNAPLKTSMTGGYSSILSFDQQSTQYAIQIYNWSYIKRYGIEQKNTDTVIALPEKHNKILEGDIIRFEVNFRNKSIAVYINDYLLDKDIEFFRNIKCDIIPAVGNSGQTAVYTLRTVTPLK